MVPQLPQGAFDEFQSILGFFSDMAGMQPIMQGKGEPGVRAQSHAKTLLRSASSRIRDRALLVERKFEEFVQKCFALLAAKKSDAVGLGANMFQLAQLPPGFSVRIDSHTSSPAFADDARELAFALHERGASRLRWPNSIPSSLGPPVADISAEAINPTARSPGGHFWWRPSHGS
jgi:hypothetical protein